MLRFLALLVVCTASLLMQGEPAAAHEERFLLLEIISETTAGHAVVSVSSSAADDCPSGQACCMAACAPCLPPLPGDRSESITLPFETSAVVVSPEAPLRSNVTDRDPPIPRRSLV